MSNVDGFQGVESNSSPDDNFISRSSKRRLCVRQRPGDRVFEGDMGISNEEIWVDNLRSRVGSRRGRVSLKSATLRNPEDDNNIDEIAVAANGTSSPWKAMKRTMPMGSAVMMYTTG